MMSDTDKIRFITKESLYKMSKENIPFTPFNYYKVFAEVALENGVNNDDLHKMLYGKSAIDNKDIESMKNEIIAIADDVGNVTESVKSTIESKEEQYSNVTFNIEHSKEPNSIMLEIEKIKYINLSLKSELEAARNVLIRQKKAIENIKSMSSKDFLTGLYTRGYMYDFLKEVIYKFKRYKQPFSIIMIDLDDFKNINDVYGHLAGDAVLKDFSLMIKQVTRMSDVCVRYGGDEFIIILPETTLEQAKLVAEKIQTKLNSVTFKKGDSVFKVSISIGITAVRENDTDETILERVDKALYQSKNQGKNIINTV